eukprot:14231125-Alexandrium_andersonii.AAC.1
MRLRTASRRASSVTPPTFSPACALRVPGDRRSTTSTGSRSAACCATYTCPRTSSWGAASAP